MSTVFNIKKSDLKLAISFIYTQIFVPGLVFVNLLRYKYIYYNKSVAPSDVNANTLRLAINNI